MTWWYLPVYALMIAALFLALAVLLRGPSLTIRVIALDLMAAIAVGLIAIHAVVTDQIIYLDVALALALVGFLGTVAFARFIEKGELPWGKA